jgi:hypothetical protein
MFTSTNFMFKSLTDAEVEDFRSYARDNYREMADDLAENPGKWTLWHPVTVAEFFKIREEAGA